MRLRNLGSGGAASGSSDASGGAGFNAVDVETANGDRRSICQIGIVSVRDGEVADEWKTLVDPRTEFDPWNTKIHGITEDDVAGAPTFRQIGDEVRRRLEDGGVVISHTSFDFAAVNGALESLGSPPIDARWGDSARFVRHVWRDRYGRRGYGIANVARDLGIDFDNHHDALADARAAALVTLEVLRDYPAGLDRLLRETPRRAPAARPQRTREDRLRHRQEREEAQQRYEFESGPEDAARFAGHVLVFTGPLGTARERAKTLAERVGFEVHSSVTRKTTVLVVGGDRAGNGGESGKLRKVRQMVAAGYRITILDEEGFLEAVAGGDPFPPPPGA